jgi:hypothetical protein
MKNLIITIYFLFIALTSVYSQNNSDFNLLHHQMGNQNDIGTRPSYKNPDYWVQQADDFIATSDWEVDQIIVTENNLSTIVDGLNIYIYTNNNETPGPGTLIYSASTQSFSISPAPRGDYCSIVLDTPIILSAGHYWISVQSQNDFNNIYNLEWWECDSSYYDWAMYRDELDTTWRFWENTWAFDMCFELYGNTVTPVELTSFTASITNNDVTLNWITATETNNSGFQVERRETKNERNEEWKNISFINGNGTTTETKTYSFKDENLAAGKYQFRLKQIDFDGTFEYSNIIEAEILSPLNFSLGQNYPNPFNPSTNIRYSTPNGSLVLIKVYDVLGKEVATLVNENKPAGEYVLEFNAADFPSGIYFYKLQAGSFVETKKMILMK